MAKRAPKPRTYTSMSAVREDRPAPQPAFVTPKLTACQDEMLFALKVHGFCMLNQNPRGCLSIFWAGTARFDERTGKSLCKHGLIQPVGADKPGRYVLTAAGRYAAA